jgi:hypothetical protein
MLPQAVISKNVLFVTEANDQHKVETSLEGGRRDD